MDGFTAWLLMNVLVLGFGGSFLVCDTGAEMIRDKRCEMSRFRRWPGPSQAQVVKNHLKLRFKSGGI
jgi:hypothetical protein